MPKRLDYFCAKIPWYPSDSMGFDTARKITRGQEMIQAHMDFYNKFLQQVFNKSKDFFYKNYGCFTEESIIEFLEIWHGIKKCEFESNYYHYLIPIRYTELIDWVIANWPNGSRQMIRFSIPLLTRTEFHFVPMARQFTINTYQKAQVNADKNSTTNKSTYIDAFGEIEAYIDAFGEIEELTLADKIDLR